MESGQVVCAIEPEPDIVIVRNRDYSTMHPESEDVLLLVEVAGPTIEYDRGIKVPFCARFNIPEVWLINIERHCIEVYRQPDLDQRHYKRMLEVAIGTLAPTKLIRTERRGIRFVADALTELTPTLNSLTLLYFSPLVFELGGQSFND